MAATKKTIVRYRFTPEIFYVDSDTNKQTEIKIENIKGMVIEHEFEKRVMPVIYLRLDLDKNLIDEMILKADKNIINFAMYKFVYGEDVQQVKDLYFKDQFNYFVTGDVNYRRDLDYPDPERGEEQREDIYKPLFIGLLRKKAIDDNKKTFNFTLQNPTIVSMVNHALSHTPAVIEPIEYNKSFPQLVIPPTSSVDGYLKLLNKTSVFYSTPYRYYIDLDTSYLLSSSGKATARKGEKYQSVIFNLLNIKDKESMVQGMIIDDEIKAYVIPIESSDSKYEINRATDKTISSIVAAIDNSRLKAMSTIKNVQNIINNVTNSINKVNSIIEKNINNANALASSIMNYGNILKFDKLTVSSGIDIMTKVCDLYIKSIDSQLASLPKNDPNASINTDGVTNLRNKLVNISNTLNTSKKLYNNLMDAYSYTRSNAFSSITNINGIGNFINGIQITNIQDNIKALSKHESKTKTMNEKNKENITKTISPLTDTSKNLIDHMSSIHNVISGNSIHQVGVITSLNPDGTPTTTGLTIDLSKIQSEHKDEFDKAKVNSLVSLNSVIESTGIMKQVPGYVDNVMKQASTTIAGIKNIGTDLKSEFTASANKITSMVNDINKNFNDKQRLNMDDIFAGKGLTSIATPGMLKTIMDDLDKVKDISSIGSLGVTKVEAKVSPLSSNKKEPPNSDKKMIVRINDDNINKVKNIKAQIESNTANVTLSKIELDPSVFTLNKEYIIKNFDSHSNRDGKFLLDYKREIYIREGDSLVSNISMRFKQLKS